MSINLSASSLSDFISCSKRFQYRITSSHEAVDTQEISVGNIVHKVIETDWNKDYKQALATATELYADRRVFPEGQDKGNRCINNFFLHTPRILETLSEDDLVEYRFKEKLFDDVYLVGKMDRVVKSLDIVYDWKTGLARKKSITSDIQAIIYYQMYYKMFRKYPKVIFVYLNENKTIQFVPNKKLIDEVFNGIIPKVVNQVRAGQYYKEGYFNGGCYRCPFIGVCSRS